MTATFTATPVILVHIEGQTPSPDTIGYRFWDWLREAEIRPVASIGPAPYDYAAGFAPDDAERVIAWLRENGCDERRSG